MADVKLMHGDCLDLMREIPDGSVDLVLCDPPYGVLSDSTKDMYGWEDKNVAWDSTIEPSSIFDGVNRILRPNGRCVLFSQEPYTSQLITSAIPSLPFAYRAIWLKPTAGNSLMAKAAMVSRCEDVCVFSKVSPKHDFAGANPLREYFRRVFDYIGVCSCKEINAKLGHRRAEHCFYVTESRGRSGGSSQFSLCTEQTYTELISVYGIDKMDGFTEYASLREVQDEYQAHNTDEINSRYPSTFNLWQGKKSKSNVLEYAKDNDGYHPTQKPVALLEDLIKTYSNEGDTVLDFTMGSGSTGVACVNTGRNFIGIELDEGYFAIAQRRIDEAASTPRLAI